MDQMPQAGAPAPQKSGSVLKVIVIILIVLFVLGILGILAMGFLAKMFFNKMADGGVENFIENQIEQQTGQDADIDLNSGDGSVSIKTGEGSFQVASDGAVTVPADISAAAPVMSGAVAKAAATGNPADGSAGGAWAFFASSASADDIKAYYIKEMTDRGWTKVAEISQAGMAMLSFEKGEQVLAVNIGAGAGAGAGSADAGFQLILSNK